MWRDDPRAYSDYSPMISLMYYLDDTSRENGCLRYSTASTPSGRRKRSKRSGR